MSGVPAPGSDFADWLAIANLKARYCRLLDTKDWEGFAALFTEDFVLDVSGAGGMPAIVGRDAAVAMVRASIDVAITAHQVHSPEIEIDGDSATGIWAMNDRVIWSADRPSACGYGHYTERYARAGSEWKIAESSLTRLHVDYLPPSGGS